jgi:hypothetical protein
MKTWHNVLAKAKLVCVKFGLSGLPSRYEGGWRESAQKCYLSIPWHTYSLYSCFQTVC